jgi:prepilin-type N-terminal cleavage/methylation domain-containing protein
MNKKAAGFSLIELSIVLVILGLLTGGILAGKSLIRAAETRSVITEQDRYRTAVHAFRDKYFFLPGDMPNATAFWPAGDATSTNIGYGTSCVAGTTNDSSKTCNGDGNGWLDQSHSGTSQEGLILWNHLALAGLIEGRYYYNNSVVVLGKHVPASKLGGGAGWNTCYTSTGNYGRGANNMFAFGGIGWGSTACSMGLGVLTPEEAWNIDTKLDDGQGGTGYMTAEDGYPNWGLCVSSGYGWTNLPSNYKIANKDKYCRIYFLLK